MAVLNIRSADKEDVERFKEIAEENKMKYAGTLKLLLDNYEGED